MTATQHTPTTVHNYEVSWPSLYIVRWGLGVDMGSSHTTNMHPWASTHCHKSEIPGRESIYNSSSVQRIVLFSPWLPTPN